LDRFCDRWCYGFWELYKRFLRIVTKPFSCRIEIRLRFLLGGLGWQKWGSIRTWV
jgi:hypothetical protein